MRLYVSVLEARGLPSTKASDDAYVKLRAGNHKSRTRTVRGSRYFVWNEEFVFRVEEVSEEEEEMKVRVFYEAGSGGGEEQLVGCVRVPLCTVLDEGRKALPPTWFSLQTRHLGHVSSKSEDSAASGLSDPYVVFSCNGKTRTSSRASPSTLKPKLGFWVESVSIEEEGCELSRVRKSRREIAVCEELKPSLRPREREVEEAEPAEPKLSA